MKAIAIAALLLTTAPAHAAGGCGPLETVVSELSTKYKEHVVWEGVVKSLNGPSEVLLFQSSKGTWSLIAVVGVVACVLAVGRDGTPIGLPT